MHTIIQELRGNVRVFARIRPFPTDDGKQGEEGNTPHVSHDGDIVSVVSSGCVLSCLVLSCSLSVCFLCHVLYFDHRLRQATQAKASSHLTESFAQRIHKRTYMMESPSLYNHLWTDTMYAYLVTAKLGKSMNIISPQPLTRPL